MALKTVRVPEAMEGAFAKAEEIVNRYFRQRKHDPGHGTIEIFGERYVLVRAASLSVEFFSLVEDLYGPGRAAEAQEFSRNILFDLAHSIGKSDAQNFHGKMGLTDPIARLSAGPIHFANTGWAFVDIFPQSVPSADETYYLIYDHPYSFESDAWLRAGKTTEAPVCIMNSGYSSGWCEESFGIELVATEILCRARGDSCCRFIMAPPGRIEEHVRRYSKEGASRGYEVRAYQVPDFFARKRMEEELRRARDDLEKRVEERTGELRAEMAERAEVEKKLLHAQKLEAVGKLAGGIAHDFNNLLAVVMGNTALLAQRLRGDPSLDRHFYAIQRAAERGAELTQQLLAFSRGKVRSREVLDVCAIVADLERLLSRVIGEDVKLVVALAPEPLHVSIGRGELDQVLMNLVVNARDAMPAGGEIRIETSKVQLGGERVAGMPVVEPGPYVRLSISDTGVGMDEGTLGHVFEPFFTTKEDGRGTGLGLATVYGIVRHAGGNVSV
ncbi:MAG: hypothetical protein HY720_05275, partial [Planctomycetes bacterium]|nr:hypothetical protein [Planctomycetota bacterium]